MDHAVDVSAPQRSRRVGKRLLLAGRIERFGDAKWGGALLGNGSWPGDILKDTQALDQARSFFDSVPDSVAAGLVGSAA